MQRRTWALWGGIGSVLLGLPYIFRVFGPMEAEVVRWGTVSVYLGVGLIILSLALGNSDKALARLVLALGYTGLALLQILPIILWFVFHGSGISDGTPPSAFVAHWGYALPHLVVFTISLVVLVMCFYKRNSAGHYHHLWIIVVLLAACAPSPAVSPPTTIISPTAAQRSDYLTPQFPDPTPVSQPPTAAPTLAPTPEIPFPRTRAWFTDVEGPYPDEARLRQLSEVFIADTLAYLDIAIAPDVPLTEQQAALARMATDLPGMEGGQVLPVDIDPQIDDELVISARIGGAPLLYAYGDAGHWQVVPVPRPGNMEVDPNLWPGAVEAQDLTGDGATELLATYSLLGGSGYWDYLQVFHWTGEDFIVLFRADLLNWAGESRYTLEPDPTQVGALQIALTYPHLYSLGFDHKMLNHPLGRQVWRWDAGAGCFALAESGVDLERSAWGESMEVTVEDLLRWLVNEGETRFRQGEYKAAVPWYVQTLVVAKAEAWEPAGAEPHWAAFASFRRAQLFFITGQVAEGRAAMQPIANSWPGDPLSALAHAYLEGYGEGGVDAAEHAVKAMRAAVDLEDHFYNERPGLLRHPMDAEGILFNGIASLPPAPEWPRVGTFD